MFDCNFYPVGRISRETTKSHTFSTIAGFGYKPFEKFVELLLQIVD